MGTLQCQTQYIRPFQKLPGNFLENKDVVFDDTVAFEGQCYLPTLKAGDILRFELVRGKEKEAISISTSGADDNGEKRKKEKVKPKAFRVEVESFIAHRSLEVIKAYFDSLSEALAAAETKVAALNTIVTCPALWDYLLKVRTFPVCSIELYIRCLYMLLKVVIPLMKAYPVQKAKIMATLSSLKLTEHIRNDGDRCKVLHWQIEQQVESDPSKLKDCLPSLGDLVRNSNTKEARFLHRLLLKTARLVDLEKWQELETIPSSLELMGDPLEKGPYLKPVHTNTPYESASQYLNVYYRLLRAECFSSIQKGITDFKKGQLDTRDMSLYFSVAVAKVSLYRSRVVFYLKFRPDRPVKNWNASRRLMFGNLHSAVCIG